MDKARVQVVVLWVTKVAKAVRVAKVVEVWVQIQKVAIPDVAAAQVLEVPVVVRVECNPSNNNEACLARAKIIKPRILRGVIVLVIFFNWFFVMPFITRTSTKYMNKRFVLLIIT